MSSSPHGENAARWLDGKQRMMEERIADLVEVNSFTDNVEGGRAVGKRLARTFAIDALDARTVSSSRYADHLVLSSKGEPALF